MKILDLGCGVCKHKGSSKDKVIGVDKVKTPCTDVVCDVEKKLPFKNNEFDKVIAIHILEHVSNLVKVMEEVWRVCKPNAEIFINVPYFTSSGAYDDPTHKRFFTYYTFDYFTHKFKTYNPGIKAKFEILEKRIMFFGENLPENLRYLKIFDKILTPIINKIPRFYQSYLAWLMPSREIHYRLKALK
jgi:ubiquinone/menaquinone biosynthesis C-methylase UbiE